MKPILFGLLGKLAAGALRVWIIVGILLRVTHLRDRWEPLAIVFYSTPWPVMAAGFLALALHAKRIGYRHGVRRYLAFTVGALFTWFALSWYSAPEPEPAAAGETIRVVSWNVAGAAKVAPIAQWLNQQDADLIVLAEGQAKERKNTAEWQALLPGYQVLALKGEMMGLARGELVLRQQGGLGPHSFYALYEAEIRGAKLTVLQADLYAGLEIPRRPALERLAEIAKEHEGERLLVAGDFNTPRESVGFDGFRGFLTHAFEGAGSGIAETWPLPCPALSIDHVWVSQSAKLRSAKLKWSWRSDHRPMVVELGK